MGASSSAPAMALIEFRSVVDAVRCAIEVQNGMVERNAGVPEDAASIPRRRSSGRRRRGGRRRPHGRRRGYRRAARRHLQRRSRSVSPSKLTGKLKGGSISRSAISAHATQEHRRADPGLFARSRQAGQAKPKTKPAYQSGIRRRWPRDRRAYRDRGERRVFPQRQPPSDCRADAAAAEPARLSIVVLPFTNLSNDPSQDYFADGVTENLTTELSRIHNSFVIARNTAFSFKGKNVDAREIGRELGVRYVLEGSVQRTRTGCASTPSSLTRKPARIFGPTASRKTSPTCSSSRIRSWRD